MSTIIDKPIKKRTKSDGKPPVKKSRGVLSSTDTSTTSSSTLHAPMMVEPSLLEDGEFDENASVNTNLDGLNDLHSDKSDKVDQPTSANADEPVTFKVHKTPRLPLYDQATVNRVTEMFPKFKETA